MDFLYEKISVSVKELEKHRKKLSYPLSGFLYRECEPKTNNILPDIKDGSFSEFVGDAWEIDSDRHAWFYKKIEIPKEMQNQKVRLEIRTDTHGWNVLNPQFLVYVNGKVRQGLDINHPSVLLGTEKAYDVFIYAYSGGGKTQDFKFRASIYVSDELCEKVFYDIKVPMQVMEYMEKYSKEYADISEHLTRALNLIDFRRAPGEDFAKTLKDASDYMDSEFYAGYCKEQNESVVCIGHTHIDVAWKWTLAQTREKVQRSFSNVLTIMKEYPEFKFMQSQPILYKYIKEENPETYLQIKEKIKEGRWEAEGGMWVESDCNLPSGESFVRQFLFGKRFFKNEFGVESKVFWVPDVFGYSPSLPQIIKKSGVDYFVTSKLSWNEKNMLPYDIFYWKGIDGSEVNGYFLTSKEKIKGTSKPQDPTRYNAQTTPKYAAGTFERLQQKGLTDEALLAFGYGDGGGGPTRENLEYIRRLSKGVRGCPNEKIGFAGEFLKKLFDSIKDNNRVPTWEGELYFELHRGTYTSIAKNKKNNRISEFLYGNAEQLSVLSMLLFDDKYPQKKINEAWEIILVNQFHDIIPGSSIKEVYDVSDREYSKIINQGQEIEKNVRDKIAQNIKTEGGVLVFNPHSFTNSAEVRVEGELVYAENIPSKGYKVIQPKKAIKSVKVENKKIENEFFLLEFDDKYFISRLYDKKNDREVLKAGSSGNKLVAFEDLPKNYDAWEISEYYTEKSWDVADVSAAAPIFDGVRAGVSVTRKFLSSEIKQNIWLYENTPKIDFETTANWQEHHILLKTFFPTDIRSTRATYDVQFGNIERSTLKNTSWDTARFEVFAHKYADISEGNYGVSLMNDCKYGYDVYDGKIGLSLIKCATDPYPQADIGIHNFVYSLYPHSGTLTQSDTVKLSYNLNQPMFAISLEKQDGILPDSFSMVRADKENIIIETIKKAEDDDGIIVRMYENTNSKTKAVISFGFDITSVEICNLIEEKITDAKVTQNKIELNIHPFEIVTLKVK